MRWQLQDLRERMILAQAEQVKIERVIREVVRDPLNRAGVGWSAKGAIPLYTSPSDALGALRGMRRLVKLVRPGVKNRVSPDVLLTRWEAAERETADLRRRYRQARQAMISIGMEVR